MITQLSGQGPYHPRLHLHRVVQAGTDGPRGLKWDPGLWTGLGEPPGEGWAGRVRAGGALGVLKGRLKEDGARLFIEFHSSKVGDSGHKFKQGCFSWV